MFRNSVKKRFTLQLPTMTLSRSRSSLKRRNATPRADARYDLGANSGLLLREGCPSSPLSQDQTAGQGALDLPMDMAPR